MTISARRQRTRTALQEAALTVFARRGVAGASIEEICEEGGFTRGAFYSNYATKDELVLAIIDEEFALAVEGASGLVERLHGDEDRCGAVTPDTAGATLDTTGGTEGATGTPAETAASGSTSASGSAGAADGTAGSPSDTPPSPHDVMRRALEEFRFPFASSPARIIAMRDIELHSLRHPQLRTRLDEVMQSHKARLHSTVAAILTHYGARSTVPLGTLIDICHTCYDAAATEAVAAHPDAEVVTVDRSLLLTVLIAFVEFPPHSRPADSPSESD